MAWRKEPVFKALPRNSDGEIAQSDFPSDNTKIRRAVAALLERIFVKYDGKDANKCALQRLRGDAFI